MRLNNIQWKLSDGEYQHEPKGRLEVEYSRAEDRAFDQMVGNDEPRPRQDPTRNQV